MKNNNKVAFLTGITGQDGSYLAEFLLEKNYEVHAILRRASVFTTSRIDHILDNPNLEQRAKQIGQQLRCLVCQNEDIQNSNADIAKDLRILVRKLLVQNKSDKEIIKFVHERYGDFVLFSPPLRPDTMVLWLLPAGFFILMIFFFFRRQK